MPEAAIVMPRPGNATIRGAAALWSLPVLFLAIVILYPIFSLFGVLFHDDTHIVAMLENARLVRILVNTIKYTVLSTTIALCIGLPLAWNLSRRDDRTAAAARALIALAFVLPEFIYAIAYAFLLEPNTGYLTMLLHRVFPGLTPPLYGLVGMSIITGLFCVPQIAILVEPALRNIGAELDEAAETCGASTVAILRRVTLPLAAPAILTAALLTFLLAFASFGIPAALGIPVSYFVLSTEVFSVVSTYPPQFGEAAILSIIFLAVGLIATGGQIYATRLSNRYRTISGKGFRRRSRTTPAIERLAASIYVWFCVLAVSVLPLLMIFAASISKSWWKMPGPVTLEHYAFVLAHDPLIVDVARTTIAVTVITTFGCIALALMVCGFVSGRHGTFAVLVRLLGYVALSVPPIAFTIGALLAYVKPPLALYGTIWILVFTYWARFYPLAAGPISDGFAQLDPALIEAAHISGANTTQTFWRIQLPLMRGVTVAAALVVTMFTVRELLSAVFLQSSQVKMAMVAIFNYWDEGNLERAAAMSGVVLALCAVIFFAANRFQTSAAWHR